MNHLTYTVVTEVNQMKFESNLHIENSCIALANKLSYWSASVNFGEGSIAFDRTPASNRRV